MILLYSKHSVFVFVFLSIVCDMILNFYPVIHPPPTNEGGPGYDLSHPELWSPSVSVSVLLI